MNREYYESLNDAEREVYRKAYNGSMGLLGEGRESHLLDKEMEKIMPKELGNANDQYHPIAKRAIREAREEFARNEGRATIEIHEDLEGLIEGMGLDD